MSTPTRRLCHLALISTNDSRLMILRTHSDLLDEPRGRKESQKMAKVELRTWEQPQSVSQGMGVPFDS